ncbi:putative NOT transcription complex subunit vip2 [Castilleja foliolosa]|uniref:NOT transcription complex subunit vip2 n=1 Tax=Castilleja foliolosa TaxID=1961234 RepID=A0ABD3EFR2_9LAMI
MPGFNALFYLVLWTSGLSSLNGSSSSLPGSTGRPFSSSFSAQSSAVSSVFHPTWSMQGLHNIHGNFYVPNMPGSLGSRSTTMNNIPSSGVQHAGGNLSSGRFASNNLPGGLSQISHSSAHVHYGLANRSGMNIVGNQGYSSSTNGMGGSIPGILPTSAAIGSRTTVPGMGVNPVPGSSGPRITSSIGSIFGGGNVDRNISSGGLPVPGLSSRLTLAANSGSGNPNVQGQNRMMDGMLQQVVLSMLGNSYPTGGDPLPQNHIHPVNNLNSMGVRNDMNSNDGAPFDVNDFPQLTSRPSSSGGPQGQLGSLRRQGLGPIVQQNQEFSIQNEDFPALPGFKGGNADYPTDLQMGLSAGFNLGATYSSHRPQQQQPHIPLASGGGGPFSNSSGPRGLGPRPLNTPNSLSGNQVLPQYQQHQNQNQFHLPQMSAVGQSFRDQGVKPMQAGQAAPDIFGLRGLLNVIKMSDPALTSLALGMDLTTLGLDLNSSENLHKTFGSPWSGEPTKGDPEFNVPQCYYAKQPPPLTQEYVSKFQLNTLFYIFYSMPKDEAQLYAANEIGPEMQQPHIPSASGGGGPFSNIEEEFPRLGEPKETKQKEFERSFISVLVAPAPKPGLTALEHSSADPATHKLPVLRPFVRENIPVREYRPLDPCPWRLWRLEGKGNKTTRR